MQTPRIVAKQGSVRIQQDHLTLAKVQRGLGCLQEPTGIGGPIVFALSSMDFFIRATSIFVRRPRSVK